MSFGIDFERIYIEKQIKILQEHIEHPNKPGYKRSDIVAKIKELKRKLKLNLY